MKEILEKADFSAGSDHKERLRKQLFGKGDDSMKITEGLKTKMNKTMSRKEETKAEDQKEKKVGFRLEDDEIEMVAGGAQQPVRVIKNERFQ